MIFTFERFWYGIFILADYWKWIICHLNFSYLICIVLKNQIQIWCRTCFANSLHVYSNKFTVQLTAAMMIPSKKSILGKRIWDSFFSKVKNEEFKRVRGMKRENSRTCFANILSHVQSYHMFEFKKLRYNQHPSLSCARYNSSTIIRQYSQCWYFYCNFI